MKKVWHDSAWEEYLYWQVQDKKTLKRINALVQRNFLFLKIQKLIMFHSRKTEVANEKRFIPGYADIFADCMFR